MGLTIRTPDINKSEWSFTTHDGEIVYGMGAIKGFGDSAAKTILMTERRTARSTTSLTSTSVTRSALPP